MTARSRQDSAEARTREVEDGLAPPDLCCPKCQQVYELPPRDSKDLPFSRVPKLLSNCLHTCCQSCAEESLQRSKGTPIATCPTCSMGTEARDTNSLSNNYVVLQELRKWEWQLPRQLCDSCEDEKEATRRCKDCGLALCIFHVKDHARSRRTKSHEMISISEIQGQDDVPAASLSRLPVYCNQHPNERARIFCAAPCARLICYDCSVDSHLGHEFTLLDEHAEEKHKNTLRQHVKSLKKRMATVRGAIKSVESTIKAIEQNKQEAVKQAQRAFFNIRRAIDLRENATVKALERAEKSKASSLSKQLLALERVASEYSTALDTSGLCLEKLNGDKFMAMEPHLNERHHVLEMQSKSLQLEPCVDDHISFSYNRDLADCIHRQISGLGCCVMSGDDDSPSLGEKDTPVGRSPDVEKRYKKPQAPQVHFNMQANVGVHPQHVGFTVPTDTVTIEVRGGSEEQMLMVGREGPLIGRVVLTTKLEEAGQTSFHSEQFFESLSMHLHKGDHKITAAHVPTVRFTKVLRLESGVLQVGNDR